MIHIYLVKREFGGSLILHPFAEKKQVVKELDRSPIMFHYAEGPDEDDRAAMLYGIYTVIDSAVDLWVQELKYIPRLLASAAVFLLVYLFTALVIRIPVPLVDEILFSSAAAAAVYIITAKKSTRSEVAMKRRIELKHTADQAAEVQTLELKEIQDTLSELEKIPPLKLSDMIAGRREFPADAINSSVSKDIAESLESALKQQKYGKALMKKLNADASEHRKERFSAYLYRLSQNKKIDLPLIGLFVLLR